MTDMARARYVVAPAHHAGDDLSVFLAGGISGTENWQRAAVEALAGEPVVILNPRRDQFGVDDDAAHREQISWEHQYLHDPGHRADVVLMWFAESPSPDVVQPIALYELGRLVERGTPIAVGAHHRYARRRDVLVQIHLAAPHLQVHDSLEATVTAARELLLPQQLWRACVELTTQVLPALSTLDPDANWPGDLGAACMKATGMLGAFEQIEPALTGPLSTLRQALPTAAGPLTLTPLEIMNLTGAIRDFSAAASKAGDFADLWPHT